MGAVQGHKLLILLWFGEGDSHFADGGGLMAPKEQRGIRTGVYS